MAITSFPWASVGGDRPVSDAMDAAYYAGVHGDTLIYGFTPTIHQSTNVRVSAGMAVVQGRVIHSDAAVVLTPTVNTRQRVVLRLDLTNRTAEVALSGTTTSYPSLTRTGATWELGLAEVNTTGAITLTDTRNEPELCRQYDTGLVTSGVFVAQPDFSIVSQSYRRIGNVVQVYGSFTRTAASLTSDDVRGDINNTKVAAVLEKWGSPRGAVSLTSGGPGPNASYIMLNNFVEITSITPPHNASGTYTAIPQGSIISVFGTYLVG